MEFVQAEGQTNVRTFPVHASVLHLACSSTSSTRSSRIAPVRQALSYAIDRQAIIDSRTGSSGYRGRGSDLAVRTGRTAPRRRPTRTTSRRQRCVWTPRDLRLRRGRDAGPDAEPFPLQMPDDCEGRDVTRRSRSSCRSNSTKSASTWRSRPCPCRSWSRACSQATLTPSSWSVPAAVRSPGLTCSFTQRIRRRLHGRRHGPRPAARDLDRGGCAHRGQRPAADFPR